MSTSQTTPKRSREKVIFDWLGQPVRSIYCLFSWLGATAIFFAIADALGGPTEGDVAESAYGTWAVAHAHLACVYPPNGGHGLNDLANPFAVTAPLYPLFSGAWAALLRIGHAVAFPSQAQLGPHCSKAFVAIFNWSVKSDAIMPTIRLSYLMWPILLAAVIALVRATGRGHTGWEPLSVVLLALTGPVYMSIVDYFHPQDILAFALVLGALACVLRDRWAWAGVLLGLAFTSQQFSLLVALPLLVIVPPTRRLRYVTGGVIAAVVIDLPLIIASSGRGIKTVLFGSSRVGSNIRSTGGTVLWEVNLRGVLLFLVARVLPLVAVLALAWWAAKRLGPTALTPVALLALATTSMVLRLVFEVNLFGYYFMATAVLLLLLNVAAGHIRGCVIAWIGLVTLAFNPVHWGLYSNLTLWSRGFHNALPIALLAIGLLTVVVDATNRQLRIYKVLWVVVVALTCTPRSFGTFQVIFNPPHWLWQLILVPTALMLAIEPLLTASNKSPKVATTSVSPEQSEIPNQ